MLPGINGDESWELPPPATYVITEDRCVVLAYVDVDCRRRLAPEDIVAALHSLERRTAGRARAPMRPPLLTAAAIKGECILSAQALPCLGIFFHTLRSMGAVRGVHAKANGTCAFPPRKFASAVTARQSTTY